MSLPCAMHYVGLGLIKYREKLHSADSSRRRKERRDRGEGSGGGGGGGRRKEGGQIGEEGCL